jgi:hypothetical protein
MRGNGSARDLAALWIVTTRSRCAVSCGAVSTPTRLTPGIAIIVEAERIPGSLRQRS